MDLGLDLLVLLSNMAPLDKSLLLSIMREGEIERGRESKVLSPTTLQHTQVCIYKVLMVLEFERPHMYQKNT